MDLEVLRERWCFESPHHAAEAVLDCASDCCGLGACFRACFGDWDFIPARLSEVLPTSREEFCAGIGRGLRRAACCLCDRG